jgi:hypothetical protein
MTSEPSALASPLRVATYSPSTSTTPVSAIGRDAELVVVVVVGEVDVVVVVGEVDVVVVVELVVVVVVVGSVVVVLELVELDVVVVVPPNVSKVPSEPSAAPPAVTSLTLKW